MDIKYYFKEGEVKHGNAWKLSGQICVGRGSDSFKIAEATVLWDVGKGRPFILRWLVGSFQGNKR